MTEGPTARLRAIQINEEFLGETLQDIFTRSKKLHVKPSMLIGYRLDKATSFGKNILLYFNDYIIRLHLMMYGSIRFEKEYSKPFKRVRLTLFFSKNNLVVYNAPIVEIDKKDRLEERLFSEYGVDPMTNWDEERLIQLILKYKDRKIGDLLLDQKVFNGIGNILRNEILFRAKINPERIIRDIDVEEIKQITYHTQRLSYKFLELKRNRRSIKNILFVYNKKYCPICKDKLVFYRQEPNGRKTFYCPNCQI